MVGLPLAFSNALMGIWREDQLIGFPQVTETLTTFIARWDTLPKELTGLLASVTDGIGNDLACSTTHGSPQPAFLPVFLHKRPHLVHFQHIFWLDRQERFLKFWSLLVFF